jgi:putative MATE family efflux protein
MLLQIPLAIIDTWYVGRLGTDALAAIALVFPVQMMVQNIAAGAMGGAAAAAVARALGAGRREDARALIVHAVLLALGFGLVIAAVAWTVAPSLYRVLGGSGPTLERAVAYSNVWFGGGVAMWLNFFLSAMLRGSGDALTPSRIGMAMSFLYLPLAALLAFGLGWPGFGLSGLAMASIATNNLAALLNARVLWRRFAPSLVGMALRRALFTEILEVGVIGSFSTITANVTIMLVTGLVGTFGTAALAGYGICVRLEFMVSPIAFGIGVGATTLVGIAAGAGQWQHAVRAAWAGGLAAALGGGVIGWAAALFPEAWARLFSSEPAVIAAAIACITRVAPFYCLFALGLTLYFASQGARRMAMPFAAGFVRLATAALGGSYAAKQLGLGLDGVFDALAVSFVVYGVLIAGGLLIMPWRARAAHKLL